VRHRLPGNNQSVGLRFQPAPVDAQASSSLGLSMTSRSLRPLASPDMNDLRWLSMSLILRRATSARRAPVAYSVISRMR